VKSEGEYTGGAEEEGGHDNCLQDTDFQGQGGRLCAFLAINSFWVVNPMSRYQVLLPVISSSLTGPERGQFVLLMLIFLVWIVLSTFLSLLSYDHRAQSLDPYYSWSTLQSLLNLLSAGAEASSFADDTRVKTVND